MTLIRSYRLEPRDLQPFVDAARGLLNEGKDLETVWHELRHRGCDISDSIAVTMSVTGMIHREAKWAVCHSETWSDIFPAIVRLHDSIEQALIQIAEEEPGAITVNSGAPAESTR
jgi:hypothetical protein